MWLYTARIRWQASERIRRGRDIQIDHGRLINLSPGYCPRPSRHKGRSYPTIREHTFLPDQRQIERTIPRTLFERRAVVADEKDDRVPINA